jgi:hypothetical protein
LTVLLVVCYILCFVSILLKTQLAGLEFEDVMLVDFLSSLEDAHSWRVLLSYLNDTLLQHPAALAEEAATAALEAAGEAGAALQGLMAAQAAHRQRMLLEHVPLQVCVRAFSCCGICHMDVECRAQASARLLCPR